MLPAHMEVAGQERLREALEAIPGVARVLTDGRSADLFLLCEAGQERAGVERAVGRTLRREGIEPDSVSVQVIAPAGDPLERRVRFHDVLLTRPRVGIAAVSVRLEWDGQVYEGKAEGDGGLPLELRVSARAALRALESVLGSRVRFELVGVKSIRIFDHDFVAVLLRSADVPERRLIGVSLSAADLPAATARAVLNATNRFLGSYLDPGD